MINDNLVDKKVLHIQTGSACTGGVSRYVSRLVSGLSTDCSQFFVTCLRCDLAELESNRLYGSAKLAQVFRKDKNIWYILGLFAVIKLIKKENIQIVHFHCLKSALLAIPLKVLCNSTMVYTNHGLRYTQKKSFTWLIYLFLELCVAKLVTNYISIRESDDILIRKYFANNDKMQVIKTPSGPVEYKPKRHLSLDTSQSSTIYLTFVGSLIENKNPLRFLSWIEELNSSTDNKVEAHIFGEGHLELRLKNEVLLKKLPVIFHGNVNQEVIFRFYNDNQLVYYCLTSDIDTLPLAALEAYSFGIPIITNDRPGLTDYFNDGESGYVCSCPRNLKELEQKLFSPTQYISLSSSTKEFSLRNFPSFKSWLSTYGEIYGMK